MMFEISAVEIPIHPNGSAVVESIIRRRDHHDLREDEVPGRHSNSDNDNNINHNVNHPFLIRPFKLALNRFWHRSAIGG